MAHTAKSQVKTRPKNTQTILNADGSTGTITWIRHDSLIKRVRRYLAKKNHRLLISAECSTARDEFGVYAVLDADGHPLQTHADLPALARFLGQLADDEMIELPPERGWRFHIAKKHSAVIEGQNSVWLERVSRDFRTEIVARKALEAMENRVDLVIIGEASEGSSEVNVWEREQQARQAEALAEIETAIEANPVLRHLRSEAGCPITWGRAVEIDRQLQQDRLWAGKPVAERLNEVARLLVEADLVSEVSL